MTAIDAKTKANISSRLLDSVGEGKGGMSQEDSIETCILSMVKILLLIEIIWFESK